MSHRYIPSSLFVAVVLTACATPQPQTPAPPTEQSDFEIHRTTQYELHAPRGADLSTPREEVRFAYERFEQFFGDAPYIAVTLFRTSAEMMAFDLTELHERGVPHLPWYLGGNEPPSLEGARALSHETCHVLFHRRARRRTGWTPPATPPRAEDAVYGAETVPDWMDEAAAVLCEFPELRARRASDLAETTPLPLDSLFTMEHPSLATLRRMLAQAQAESAVVVGTEPTTSTVDPLLFYAQTVSVAEFIVQRAGARAMARIADTLMDGGSMEDALAREPSLPDSVAALEREWLAWRAAGSGS